MPWNLSAQKNITISSVEILNSIIESTKTAQTENKENLRDVLSGSDIKKITDSISSEYKIFVVKNLLLVT